MRSDASGPVRRLGRKNNIFRAFLAKRTISSLLLPGISAQTTGGFSGNEYSDYEGWSRDKIFLCSNQSIVVVNILNGSVVHSIDLKQVLLNKYGVQ